MKKLRLDRLKVESFATEAVAPHRGTIQGHDGTLDCGGGGGSPPTRGRCTQDVQECADTQYFDCSLGCTVETNCYC